MIDYFESWEMMLQDQVFSGSSVQNILELIQNEFNYPIAVLRLNGEVLCHTADYSLMPTDELRHLIRNKSSFRPPEAWPFVTDELRNQIRNRSASQSYHDRPFFLSLKQGSVQNVLVCLSSKSDNRSHVMITYEKEKSFLSGDIFVFQSICELIEKILSFESSQAETSHPLSGWYLKQLETENGKYPRQLPSDYDQWDLQDYFMIACIESEKPQLKQYEELIETLSSKDYCCVLKDGYLSVLIHAGKVFPKTQAIVREKIIDLCQKYHMRAGFSLIFQDLTRIPEFFDQSVLAMQRAKKRKLSVFSIDEALPEYLLQSCRQISGLQAYVHPDILKLADADSDGNDSLLYTLYMYIISGRSVSHTADALFIHRNTLRSRLGKIQKIITADLEDPSQLEYILLSLIIFQH